MKKYLLPLPLCTLLTIVCLMPACIRSVVKDSSIENINRSNKVASHPKLIKTIDNPRYGNVQCILQDKTGNLWFGTTENGLYLYDGKSFTQYLMEDGLNSNSVYTLFEDTAGKIWIGTEIGLCIYTPSTSLQTTGKSFTEIKIPLPQNQPPNQNELYRNKHWVFSIIQAKSGKLWFATIDGVFIYDGSSFTPFIIKEAANGFLSTNHNVERILEDKAGNIWFGSRTDKGVYRYDGKSLTHLNLPELFQDGPVPKPHNWGWPQCQDKDGTIWFSNWGGAYRYDGKTVTSFTKKDGLHGGVSKIIEDKKGIIWLGGDANSGLSRYDGKSFTHFSVKDGLLNTSIWSILEDNTGNLWIGTRETSLFLFDGKSFTTYSEYKQ